jgi:hypothetical protein
MFCSQGILGLGIGKMDLNYPLFGIPSLRFWPGWALIINRLL